MPSNLDYDYIHYRDQVVEALADLPQGNILAETLIAERNYLHLVYPHQVEGVKEIQLKEGYGPQSLTDEVLDIHFQAYLDAVINPQILSGKLTDGTNPGDYDERKVRLSGAGVGGCWSRTENTLTLEVGPTSYPRYRLDLTRSPLEMLKLMLRGIKTYQDPYAYFARGIGVAVIPLTTEGNVYLGERSQVDCSGMLNFVAGWATFSPVVAEINFYEDAQRELQEEMGIDMVLDDSNTRFIGISSNPWTGEADLVFVVQTSIGDDHFKSGQWEEHARLVRLSNKREAEVLLEKGLLPGESEPKSLMFGSRLGLEYFIQHHW